MATRQPESILTLASVRRDPHVRQIAVPRLLEVRANALTNISSLLQEAGFDLTHVCVGAGDGPSKQFGETVAQELDRDQIRATRRSELNGKLSAAATLAAHVIEEEVTLCVAVGGGKVIDTMKFAAARTGVEVVACPTTIAHDGICSPVSSLSPGSGHRKSFPAAMPAGIVVDLEVISNAPVRTIRAGVGDLVSNLTAILDWQLAHEVGEEHFDAFAAMIAENASRSILDFADLAQPGLHEVLAKGLLLSGLAMAAAGTSRPCSGAEHLISHSLDEFDLAFRPLHGEQVAVGALVAAAAHESPLLDEIRELFVRLGLPLTPADLGLSLATFTKAVLAAPATRPDRYTVLSEQRVQRDAAEILRRAFAA